MSFLPTNPDLTAGNVRPGVYISVNLSAPGGGVGQVSRRMLIMGYKQASGSYAQDTPVQVVQQSDVDAGAGAQSDLARGYKAAVAQVGAGNIDIFALPLIAPSGGTASTYKLIVGFSSGSTAGAPGSVDVSVDGRAILSVAFATGDTASSIGGNIATAINALTDVPVTAVNVSGTVTMTYVHKGDVGEDLPIRAKVNGTGTLVTLSAGTIGFATNVSGAGSFQITICGTTITTALTDAWTPAQVATAVAASVNAGSYPVTAVVDTGVSTQVDLFYAPDRDVRRMSVAVITSTGITPTLTAGTVGAGQPTLTTALSNLAALPGFAGWAVPFVGTQASVDTTTLGTIASNVELRANGVYQQEQAVHACAPWPSSVLGTLPIGTSPALTSSPRYALLWAQDVGVQGFEIACRMAAARVNNDYPPFNWDGYAFKGSAVAPLVLPAASSRPSGDTINIAMRTYFLTPVRVNENTNQLVVEKGTTTSNSTYLPLRDFATIDQIRFWRLDLARELTDKFSAVSAKRFSAPRTPQTITAQSVADAAYLLALEWDELDLYDGAATFKSGFKAQFNAQNPTRIDLTFPMSPVINVHQVGVSGNLVSPSF